MDVFEPGAVYRGWLQIRNCTNLTCVYVGRCNKVVVEIFIGGHKQNDYYRGFGATENWCGGKKCKANGGEIGAIHLLCAAGQH